MNAAALPSGAVTQKGIVNAKRATLGSLAPTQTRTTSLFLLRSLKQSIHSVHQ